MNSRPDLKADGHDPDGLPLVRVIAFPTASSPTVARLMRLLSPKLEADYHMEVLNEYTVQV